MATAAASDAILPAFARLTDPRHRRCGRHPLSGPLALTLLGRLCRQADFAATAGRAETH